MPEPSEAIYWQVSVARSFRGAALALMNLAAMLWPKLMVALAMATFSALVGYIAGGTPLAVILGSISFISFCFRIARSLVLELVQIFF